MSSRQAKLALIEALEEKRRRQLKSKPAYKPNSGQAPVHASTAKERYVFSGNGSGKSALLVNEVMAVAKGVNPWTGARTPVPARVIVVLDTSRKIEERFVPELRKWYAVEDHWLKRLGKPYTSRIELDNGSVIDFYSADADPASFEGIESSAVFIDEPIGRPLWVALRRSLRLKGHPCKLLFCGTAVDQAWLRRDIYEPWTKGEAPGVECFKVSSRVNEEHLEAGYLEHFARGLTEAEREVRLNGGFFDSDSLALAHLWARSTHVITNHDFEYHSSMPCVVGLDPHSTKPHHAVLLTVDKNNNFYVVKELRAKQTASDFAATLLKWTEGYQVIQWICDSFGSADGTSLEGFRSFIDRLNQCGVPARATTFADKNHEDLIDRLRTLLLVPAEADNYGQHIPKLRVLASCKGLIADIESATWQKNRHTGEIKPKLDTSSKDFLSCLGYALAVGLFYDKPRRMAPHYLVKPPYPSQGRAFTMRYNKARPRQRATQEDDF